MIKKINLQLKTINKSNGFTLIELLIFMGIFSILMIVLFQMFTAIFDVELESKSTSVVTQDERFIINKITSDIKSASTITSPNPGIYSTTLSFTNGTNTYTYASSSGNLILTESPSGEVNQLNSVNTYLTSLNFFRLSDTDTGSNSAITVSINLKSKAIKRNSQASESFNFTVGTRN